MKKLVLATSALGLLASLAVAQQAPDPNVAEARGIIKEFFANLKGELEAAMKAGGPTNAMQVCKVRAPLIAAEMSQKTGWHVARTSLKLRNPANKADPWEAKVLEQFDKRKAKGEDLATVDYSEVIEQGGQKTIRYMKAIPIQELCLNCHGGDLKPEVAESLKKLYPADQALGYKDGDLRGAFTLSKKL